MPYSTVDDLPTSVKDRLKSAKKRRQWLHVWNSSYGRHHDESRAFAEANSVVAKADTTSDALNFFLPITKVDKKRRTVSGYASTECIDTDGERITRAAIQDALPGYWQWRNIREMHKASAVGTAEEANIDAKGLYLTAKIVDDAAWQKIEEGVYKGFSIGGRKLAKSGNDVTKINMVEISIVDRPANPECKFDVQKSASAEAEAYLLPAPKERPAAAKALRKMAQAVQVLAEDVSDEPGEPIEKRDFNTEQRREAADSGDAMPDGSFPIKNGEDLGNAIRLAGKAKDPAAARRHIKSRAKALGLSSRIPEDWSKKFAKRQKKLAKLAKKASAEEPSFLALTVDGRAEAAEGDVAELITLDVEHARGSPVLRKGGRLQSDEVDEFQSIHREDSSMTTKSEGQPDALVKALMSLLQKNEASPAVMLAGARQTLKETKAMRKSAAAEVQSAFDIVKAQLLAHRAELRKADKEPDADDKAKDMEKALRSLQKAHGALTKQREGIASVNATLKKAQGRISGDGTVEDDEPGVYEVPDGIKQLSSSDLDKAVKIVKKEGEKQTGETITREHAEALVKAAAAEAKAELLAKMPAPGGRQPFRFDMSKAITAGGSTDDGSLGDFFKGADMGKLTSDNEDARSSEIAKAIGSRLLGGKGAKTVFDPSFHGTAGGGVRQ